jgi:diguanylate cyclase (GGDEF)-like protein/PAS domain S-box-containing protein
MSYSNKILDSMKSIVLEIKNSRIMYANNFALDFFGYKNLIGSNVYDTIIPKKESTGRSLENLISEIEKNIENYSTNINENVKADGKKVWIAWTNSVLENDDKTRSIISVGIHSSEKIQRRHNLELIYKMSLDGIGIVDLDLNFLEFNDSLVELLGYDNKNDLMNKEYAFNKKFKSHFKDLKRKIFEKIKDRESVRFEETFVKPTNQIMTADITLSKSRNLSGEHTGYVFTLRDNTEKKKITDALFDLATKDALTNIYNRRYFEELANLKISEIKRYDKDLSLLLFDLDFFKKVNDNYGHNAGDYVLQKVTKITKSNLRSSDILGRYGGEEFIILLPETNVEESYNIAERIRESIYKSPIEYKNEVIKTTISLGISEYKKNDTFENLVEKADINLYLAKSNGRNKTCF